MKDLRRILHGHPEQVTWPTSESKQDSEIRSFKFIHLLVSLLVGTITSKSPSTHSIARSGIFCHSF
jgi:hypothetical protein